MFGKGNLSQSRLWPLPVLAETSKEPLARQGANEKISHSLAVLESGGMVWGLGKAEKEWSSKRGWRTLVPPTSPSWELWPIRRHGIWPVLQKIAFALKMWLAARLTTPPPKPTPSLEISLEHLAKTYLRKMETWAQKLLKVSSKWLSNPSGSNQPFIKKAQRGPVIYFPVMTCPLFCTIPPIARHWGHCLLVTDPPRGSL